MTTKLNHQKQLEALFSKNQLLPRIREEFVSCKEFDFKVYMKAKGIDEAFGFALLVQMALHKRTNLTTLVGLLRSYCRDSQQCADWIRDACYADLLHYEADLKIFIVQFTISEDVQLELDCFQYPLPMVVEPKQIKNNRQSGYLLNNSSIILRDNHHEDDVCLDHINRVNRIKLCINQDTAKMVKNEWKNLDRMKEGETKQDFEKRKRAFEKYDRTAKEVIDLLLIEGNEFYLTHRYDKRGRTYAQGYHVNYQGNPWNKAVVEFANKEVCE